MRIYSIRLSSEARIDLRKIFDYVKNINSEYYAKRVIERIARRIATYEVFPERNEILYKDKESNIIRCTTEGKYKIIYTVSSNEVLIIRIISSKRDISKIFSES